MDWFNISCFPESLTLVITESIYEKHIWSEDYRIEKDWICGTNIDLDVCVSEIAVSYLCFRKRNFELLHNKI